MLICSICGEVQKMNTSGIYQSPKQKRFADVRERLLDLCERVENGGEITKAEKYFYCSLCYFQDRDGNDGAIDEFLNVVQAAGLL